MENQKLSADHILSIRKDLVRSRLILGLILVGILAVVLFGLNDGIGDDPAIGLILFVNGLAVIVFAGIWFWGYFRHRKISNGLPQETYTIFEGQLEAATSSNNSLMFQINGVKHFTSTRFSKYCVRGNRIRLFKTDQSRIYFHVENV